MTTEPTDPIARAVANYVKEHDGQGAPADGTIVLALADIAKSLRRIADHLERTADGH